MLHKIRIPETCRPYFEWIVELQRRLLTAICQVTPAEIDTEWVVAQLSDLDAKWVRNFCGRKDNISGVKRSMIEHIQTIAGLSAHLKRQIIDAFEQDLGFQTAFDDDSSHAYRFSGLSVVDGDVHARKAVRGFFESFYDPNFSKGAGYKIPQNGGLFKRFDRKFFLKEFRKTNGNVTVCPMCDGSLESPDVDHFYPKSHYPFLSCHRLNLAPICQECNRKKSNEPPLTLREDNPTRDWFHPYLRPAEGTFTVSISHDGNRMILELSANDERSQQRLANLEKLIRLKERWQKRLAHKHEDTLRKIGGHRRYRSRRKGRRQQMSRAELREKLQEWFDETTPLVGREPSAILTTRYLQCALNEEPYIFDELCAQATDADALTAG